MIMIKIQSSCKKERIIRPNSKETLDYLEEDRKVETELGNLEKVNKIKRLKDTLGRNETSIEKEVVLSEEDFAPHTSENEPRGDEFVGRNVLLHAPLPGPKQTIAKKSR